MRVLVIVLVSCLAIALLVACGSWLIGEKFVAWLIGGHFVEWLTAIGELAIAFVILWEVEADRASRFMDDVKGEKFYAERVQVYDAYLQLEGVSTIKERAAKFAEKLRADSKLRIVCEHQWTAFTRLRFMMRWSIHSRLLANWLPLVLVKFWVMTNGYLREHEERGGRAPIGIYGIKAVREGLEVLRKHGVNSIAIYSNARTPGLVDSEKKLEDVLLSEKDLDELAAELDAEMASRAAAARALGAWRPW